MTRSRPLAPVVALLSLALLAPASAWAQDDSDGADDRVILAGGAAVAAGETVDDLIVVEGDVAVEGTVTGDLVAVEGDLSIAGTVEGDVTAVAGKATIRRGGRIEGDLRYGDEEPEVAEGATVEGEISDEGWSDLADAPWALIGTVALWIAVTLSMLILGVVLVALLPRVADAARRVAREDPWLSVGVGIGAMIVVAVVGGAALLTLVGIPLGLVLLASLLPLHAVGYVAASYALGRTVVRREDVHPVVAFLAGFGILRAAALIPFLGLLVSALAAAVGVGLLIVAASRTGEKI